MTITKYSHCCLLIEVGEVRILTDPGSFTADMRPPERIDIVLITHEHADHLHTESVAKITADNPDVEIVTNSAVAAKLPELAQRITILEGTDIKTVCGVTLAAFDGPHVEIYKEFGQVQNTGYFIAEELFYPGDAYTNPGQAVPVLALPVSGPWCKVADVIAYAKEIAPKQAFPVHDGLLNEAGTAIVHGGVERFLAEAAPNTQFVALKDGETFTTE